jgi:acetolactate synthase I/II/III large subunit
MIKVSQYISQKILSAGGRDVFMLNGGMAMHLVNTLGHKNGLRYIANFHEQASAMAADGYARCSGKIGICYATSGPGATNLITGLTGAWQDSTPVIFITGQAKTTDTIKFTNIDGLRQVGTFEVDTESIVKPVCKYAKTILNPSLIRYELEKAISICTSGRPGPVLLDIPIDVQGALIDPKKLRSYTPPNPKIKPHKKEFTKLLQQFKNSKRPLILAGIGVRRAGYVEEFLDMVESLNIPVVTTQLGKDVIYYNHPLFIGHPGPIGDRPGNFAIQSADLIISIGSSLHSQTTGWEKELFATNAFKVQIDIDKALLKKEDIGVNLKFNLNVRDFIDKFSKYKLTNNNIQWLKRCRSWKRRYAVINEPHERPRKAINFYHFIDALSSAAPSNACIVTDAGSAFYVLGHAYRVKKNQIFISSGSMGAMGYALPAANGAAVSKSKKVTICVTGDGSLMTNIHELATSKEYNLNVIIFVINNDGYVSMRNTQNQFFEGHQVAEGSSTGVFIPSIEKITKSYNLPYKKINSEFNLVTNLKKIFLQTGPQVIEVISARNQKVIPKVASTKLANGKMVSNPLEKMSPLLDETLVSKELNFSIR